MKTLNTLAIAAACGAMAFTLPATSAEKFSVKAGGRIQLDAALVDSDDDLDADQQNHSGSEFRRVRMFLKGNGFGNIDYKVQMDYNQSKNEIKFEDVYIRFGLGGGKLWLGNFHQPFGMEELTSSKYTDFMERSMVSQTVDLGKKRGVGYSWNNENIHWMTSLFSAQDSSKTDDERVAVAGRFAYSPVHTGTNVIHLGAALAIFETADYGGVTGYRTNYHLQQNKVPGLAAVDVEGRSQFGLEFAGAWGPVAVKAEYIGVSADAKGAGDDYESNGVYASTTYTFGYNTAKTYKVKSGGTFGRIKGNNIWQVGARIDALKSEQGASESESQTLTLGSTYILNPYTRFKAELVFAESELNGADVQEDTVLQVRTQIDF